MRSARLDPEAPFPAYAYVPGRLPHPTSDPAGHSFGTTASPTEPVDPVRWADSRAYLRGFDLFNAGYYWEAHEVWEALWRACGQRSSTANLLKGLIQLAAAGVKVREGRPRGVASLATRAAGYFREAAQALGVQRSLGLSLPELIVAAERVARQAESWPTDRDTAVRVVFDFVLVPQ
jgi:hypothetical protein